jgi:hypothetical protein
VPGSDGACRLVTTCSHLIAVIDGNPELRERGRVGATEEPSQKPGRFTEPTLQWLVEALGVAEVVSCEVMPGGSTSALHRVTLRSARGTTTSRTAAGRSPPASTRRPGRSSSTAP